MKPPAVVKYHFTTGPKKWVLYVTVSISVLLALIGLYLSIRRRQKTIETLRNESEEAAQKAAQIRYDMQRNNDNQQLIALVDKTNELQRTADLKRQEISKNERDLASELKQVKALKSWKDLDAYSRLGR
jgi:hypothetical protein